jgi:alanyl-tRNA synthetase
MSTERLYYGDSYLREFTARVVGVRQAEGKTEVVLDRTAFYPESGGQPMDMGSIAGLPVVGVVEREGEIVHQLQGQLDAGQEVEGKLQWDRRFDHMQQHSGQHILSQAFEQLLDARTVSFHMGAEISNIDLSISTLSPEQAEQVEELANRVVFEDRPVRVHMLEEADLASFNLRKGTDRTEDIRVVEVPGFDVIPCGGTHVRCTGEIGMIKLVRWERRSGNVRVEFLCGRRALLDYRMKNRAVVSLAAALSVRDREVPEVVERLLRDSGELRHQIGQLRNRLLDYRAEELSRLAAPVGSVLVVATQLDEASADDLKHLALRITEAPGRVALLAAEGEKTQLVFARSEDLTIDVGSLLRQVCAPLGGRGGGRSNLAQGGIPEHGKARQALDEAVELLRSLLAV